MAHIDPVTGITLLSIIVKTVIVNTAITTGPSARLKPGYT
jgi:hypothetical protein